MIALARDRKGLAYIAFVTVCIVWGTTYLAITSRSKPFRCCSSRDCDGCSPAWSCPALMLATGRGLPKPRLWGPLALLGFLMNIVGNGFVVYAQQFVASGLTAVLIATTPFWSALIERLLPNGERFSKRSLSGLALGFSGIVVLVWPEMTTRRRRRPSFVIGVIAIQLACVGWVVGTSYAGATSSATIHFRSTALQMVFSGIMLLTAATAHGDWAQLSFTPRTHRRDAVSQRRRLADRVSAYIYAIQHLPLQLVSLYAYINPMIAVGTGNAVIERAALGPHPRRCCAGFCGDVDCRETVNRDGGL